MKVFDCLISQKIVEECEMINDWLASRQCLFPGKSSMKIEVMGLDGRRYPMSIPMTLK